MPDDEELVGVHPKAVPHEVVNGGGLGDRQMVGTRELWRGRCRRIGVPLDADPVARVGSHQLRRHHAEHLVAPRLPLGGAPGKKLVGGDAHPDGIAILADGDPGDVVDLQRLKQRVVGPNLGVGGLLDTRREGLCAVAQVVVVVLKGGQTVGGRLELVLGGDHLVAHQLHLLPRLGEECLEFAVVAIERLGPLLDLLLLSCQGLLLSGAERERLLLWLVRLEDNPATTSDRPNKGEAGK